MEKVDLILVTFNRLDTLKNNLVYIWNQNRKPDYILIVDNGSNDGTQEFLQSQVENLNPIYLSENLGFGAGLAAGIKFALEKFNFDFLWLMDDDSFPNQVVLSSLLENSIRINLSGILGVSGFKLIHGIPRPLKADSLVETADFVLVDNALLSKSAVLGAGNFREDLFMMCEDYEYCLRLKNKGFFVGVLNDSKVSVDRKHLGSQPNTHNLIWRGYYHSRNLFLILKSDYSLQNLFLYFYRQFKYLIHSMFLGDNRWLRTKFRFFGILDGFRGISGKNLDPVTLRFTNSH